MDASRPIRLSVIIVNYNVRYFLEQALYAVRKAAAAVPTEVFVVDNNSADDSVAMVRALFPEVHLIANSGNPGFSIANNQAIRISSGEYVLLLNPDTVVEEDTFETCVAFMDAHPEAGGLGVKMIDGSGTFLPESKRGFPSPFVAFCKTFGLSSLFPKSTIFNRYHLGYLDENENHEVDVLAGAFMLMRRTTLDKVGLLDEAFFMYGEDIDLSYRIVKGGYKNVYLADTRIIHYKGESTKKGSLNYVKVFYKAMIIFAKKHFQGSQARLFVFMLQAAIYFRAFLTLLSNIVRAAFLPLLDGALLYGGLWVLKTFWANYYYKDPGYYEPSFLWLNAPLYTFIWLASLYFSGVYDDRRNSWRLLRGILAGTILIAAVYGFLDMQYRSSRAVIVLGTAWALAALPLWRVATHFLKHRSFNAFGEQQRTLVIVGSREESERVEQLLHKAEVNSQFIGVVAPQKTEDPFFLGDLTRLREIVRVYRLSEVIFCSKDVPARTVIHWMEQLGTLVDYKTVPENSQSIIGSSSKNSSGELYTVDIRFAIGQPLNRRNKRLLDVFLSLFLLLTYPLHLLLVRHPIKLLQNCLQCLIGKKTWVGYDHKSTTVEFPKLRPGVLSPASGLKTERLPDSTAGRLTFFYAKEYTVWRDVEIIWRAYRFLGSPR